MKVIMDFNPQNGRKALILSAGSSEEAKLIEKYTDEEIMQMCAKHCASYAFRKPQIMEGKFMTIQNIAEILNNCANAKCGQCKHRNSSNDISQCQAALIEEMAAECRKIGEKIKLEEAT